MVKILAVLGSSNSGKTSTVEHLISQLTEKGFKIGSAKHVHHPDFTIDVEGKDTWRHAEAGAKRVVCVSEDEVAIIRQEKGHTYTVEELLKLFQDEEFDLIVLEGFHWLVSDSKDVVKIITAKDEEDAEKRLKGTRPPIIAITGLVSNKKTVESILGIPVIDLRTDAARLVKIVMEQIRSQAAA